MFIFKFQQWAAAVLGVASRGSCLIRSFSVDFVLTHPLSFFSVFLLVDGIVRFEGTYVYMNRSNCLVMKCIANLNICLCLDIFVISARDLLVYGND